MKGKEMKRRMKRRGVYIWEAAKEYGCSESTLIRHLREDAEIKPEEEKRLLAAIEAVAARKEAAWESEAVSCD